MYSYDYLLDVSKQIFSKMGCPEKDAETASKVFLAAELRGLSSHGMLRVKDYFQLWEAKRVNMKPKLRVVHETPSTAVVDGDGAIGMVAASYSMQVAIEKAQKAGSGWVSTRNSNHFGIAGYYAMMALEHDMVGMAMTNANPLVAPTFSLSRLLGTNPIAVAVPAAKHPPFVADFSTTPIARGKLAVASKKGEKVHHGYVQDSEGNPSDDPDILKQGGSMLTLGGDYAHGSHKGYCMSAVVDIFSAVFSGANFGPFVPPSVAYLPVLDKKVGEGTGHFFGAMRIDAFQPKDLFKAKMDEWIDTFRAGKSAKGQPKVLIPGDIERANEERISKQGIDLIPAVKLELAEIAKKLQVDFN
jgi:LDH2 family malate/lactate/ureidoglycolate dehydrogenase